MGNGVALNQKVPISVWFQIAIVVIGVVLAVGGYKVAQQYMVRDVQNNTYRIAKAEDKIIEHGKEISGVQKDIALVQQDVTYIKQGIDDIKHQLRRRGDGN